MNGSFIEKNSPRFFHTGSSSRASEMIDTTAAENSRREPDDELHRQWQEVIGHPSKANSRAPSRMAAQQLQEPRKKTGGAEQDVARCHGHHASLFS